MSGGAQTSRVSGSREPAAAVQQWTGAAVAVIGVAGLVLRVPGARGSYAAMVDRMTRDGPANYATNQQFRTVMTVDYFAKRLGPPGIVCLPRQNMRRASVLADPRGAYRPAAAICRGRADLQVGTASTYCGCRSIGPSRISQDGRSSHILSRETNNAWRPKAFGKIIDGHHGPELLVGGVIRRAVTRHSVHHRCVGPPRAGHPQNEAGHPDDRDGRSSPLLDGGCRLAGAANTAGLCPTRHRGLFRDEQGLRLCLKSSRQSIQSQSFQNGSRPQAEA